MRTLISLLLFSFAFSLISCSEDSGSNRTPELINTSWTRINTDVNDVSYRVKINFSSNILDFILLEPVEGHENSSVRIGVTDKEVEILEDEDCGSGATYSWAIAGDKLTLKRIVDDCEMRFLSLEGEWSRFNNELENTSWTNTDDAQLSFKVKMDFYSDHYDFLLMEEAEGHTNSTAKIRISTGEFEIVEDEDCAEPNAKYSWSIENDVLTLTKIADPCEGRLKAIEGQWNRFAKTVFQEKSVSRSPFIVNDFGLGNGNNMVRISLVSDSTLM